MTAGKEKPARVTVLLSTYNGDRFLQQQLRSLYEQTYPNVSILVRDDGSSDSTRSILDSEHSRGRIDLLEGHSNLGPAQSFFELLRDAISTDTEYVAFCDQDDVWLPQKIEHAVAALRSVTGSTPAMYCSRAEIVDEQLKHIRYTESPRRIGFGNALVENVAIGCTTVLNRSAGKLISENLPGKVLIHDWWCYLVISCFGEIIFDRSASIRYRQHGSNAFGASRNMIENVARKLRRFGAGSPGHLWLSEQALVFSAVFKELVPLPHSQLLGVFVAAKSSLPWRVQLAFSQEIWRQKRSDSVILRLLVLMNRF